VSLSEKTLQLKLNAAAVWRHALWWEKQIQAHGEAKATAFYKHLGLNHLGSGCKCPQDLPSDLFTKNIHVSPCPFVKSFEWEGLALSREPKEHEKIAVKGVASAQESSKGKITTILLKLRTELISDGLDGIRKLDPADYHTLTLSSPAEIRTSLRDRLIKVYGQGRRLVAAELGKEGKATDPTGFDDLDLLADVTTSRVLNDVQFRIIDAAQRFRVLGLFGNKLFTAVSGELEAGSVSYIDRAATGLANRVISIGRGDEARDRKDEWERVEYSALLDQNVCGPCAAEDGNSAENESDLTPTPNPDCQGGDWCRCFHVFIAEGNQ
jgi:hypothetical protein